MQARKMYAKTARLKDAKFKGQKALIVEVFQQNSSPRTLDDLIPTVDRGGRYLELLNDWARENGGTRASILYHLRQLKRSGMIEEVPFAPASRTQIVGWGNSQAIRIPKPMTDMLRLREGDEVELKIENGRLSVQPVRPDLTLDSLVEAITPENTHKETAWGKAVGNEVW